MEPINKFFTEFEARIGVDQHSNANRNIGELYKFVFTQLQDKIPYKIKLEYSWRGFNRAGIHTFDIYYGLEIIFDSFQYRLEFYSNNSSRSSRIAKLYSQKIDEHEIKTIADNAALFVLSDIKETHKRLTGIDL